VIGKGVLPDGKSCGTFVRAASTDSSRRVLVADDNRDAAESLAMLLEMQGLDVRTAHDGQEALEIAESFRPDVVLLDIGMPRLDGYEVARRIRATPWGETMCLIALTGWGEGDDRRAALDAGFSEHLVKPVEPSQLSPFLGMDRDA
jgi:CheY-like chemotaxis protein